MLLMNKTLNNFSHVKHIYRSCIYIIFIINMKDSFEVRISNFSRNNLFVKKKLTHIMSFNNETTIRFYLNCAQWVRCGESENQWEQREYLSRQIKTAKYFLFNIINWSCSLGEKKPLFPISVPGSMIVARYLVTKLLLFFLCLRRYLPKHKSTSYVENRTMSLSLFLALISRHILRLSMPCQCNNGFVTVWISFDATRLMSRINTLFLCHILLHRKETGPRRAALQ